MDCSTPGCPVHYQLPELAQTYVHQVGDAIQPSHPLLFPSPPAFNLSQYQGLFKWVSSLHQVAKLLEFQLQHQSFQWYTGLISLRIDWLDLLAVQGLAVQYSGVFSPLNDCQKTGVYKNLLFKKLIFTYLIVRNILAYKNIPMRIISMGLSLLKI